MFSTTAQVSIQRRRDKYISVFPNSETHTTARKIKESGSVWFTWVNLKKLVLRTGNKSKLQNICIIQQIVGLPRPLSKRILLQCRRWGFNPWVEKILWRRAWQPPPVFLPGQFHGQRSLVGYSLESQRVRHNWVHTQQIDDWLIDKQREGKKYALKHIPHTQVMKAKKHIQEKHIPASKIVFTSS